MEDQTGPCGQTNLISGESTRGWQRLWNLCHRSLILTVMGAYCLRFNMAASSVLDVGSATFFPGWRAHGPGLLAAGDPTSRE